MLKPDCPTCPVLDRCVLAQSRPADKRTIPEPEAQMTIFKKKDHPALTELLLTNALFPRKGVIKILTEAEEIAQIISDGGFFGPEVLYTKNSFKLHAKSVLHDLTICSLPFAAYQKYLLERPAMAELSLTRLAFRDMEARMSFHWAKRSLRERAILTVLHLRNRFGVPEGTSTIIDVPFTKIDLASIMSTVQESTVRVLSDLREEGVIGQRGKRLIVLDNPRLEKMAAEIATPAVTDESDDED